MLHFTINAAEEKPFPHYWENCVGSCHAYLALREDYRNQLKKIHEDAGFRYLRFHGLLNDDMSVVVRENDNSLRYNFGNIDTIIDFLLSIGMKPFVELSFMPGALASSSKTCFHYKGNISKPKKYEEWDELIRRLTTHLVGRYGLEEVKKWFFEVWNEPNLAFFYEGTQDDYFELYDHTARTIKSVNERLPVGGPATSNNMWISDMIRFCEAHNTPLDFISTHHYPTDDPLWEADAEAHNNGFYKRGILTEMATRAKKESGDYPLHYTEWNSSARCPDELHDLPYTAALAVKTIIDNDGLLGSYSFWTFSDIFEEGAQFPGEFHGGFGLQTVHGIPKPAYHAFQFLHMLGDRRLPVTGEQETVGMLATKAEEKIRLVAYNYDVPGGHIKQQEICVYLRNTQAVAARMTNVDKYHGNACLRWKQMGSPDYLDTEQMAALEAAATVDPVIIPIENQDDVTLLHITLPPQAVAYIEVC